MSSFKKEMSDSKQFFKAIFLESSHPLPLLLMLKFLRQKTIVMIGFFVWVNNKTYPKRGENSIMLAKKAKHRYVEIDASLPFVDAFLKNASASSTLNAVLLIKLSFIWMPLKSFDFFFETYLHATLCSIYSKNNMIF